MHIPARFAASDEAVAELLHQDGAADLVTMTAAGLMATMVPFLYVRDAGACGALHVHLSRNNPQWKLAPRGEAMAIVRGPDAYISPAWYASTAEHGWVVPTWNYVTAHLYGQLVVHDDPVWAAHHVRCLTAKHEAGSAHPWSVDDAPPDFITGMLRGIVGAELVITRIEAAAKLSQNRPEADISGAIAGLRARGDAVIADAMQRANAVTQDR